VSRGEGVATGDDGLKATLREHGLRVTAPRVVVLRVLRDGRADRDEHGVDAGHGHMSAEEIYDAVLARYPAINVVTVYRTLESFEAHALAVRVVLDDRLTRWEWIGDAHHHLVCRRCGRVVELTDEPFQRLAAELGRKHGVRTNLRHLALHGLCAHCAEEPLTP